MFSSSDFSKESFRSSRRGKRGQGDANGGYTDSVIPNKGFSAQLQTALEQREAEKEEARHTKNMQMAAEVRANADPTRSHRPGGGGAGGALDPRVQAAQFQAMGQQMAAQSMQVSNGAAVSYQPVPQVPMMPTGVATPVPPPRSGSFANYIPPPMAAMGGPPLIPYTPPACGSASMPLPAAAPVGYGQSMSQLQQLSCAPLVPVPTGPVAAIPMQAAPCPRVSYVPPPGTQLPGSGSFVAGPVAAPLVPGSGSFIAAPGMTPVMPPPGAVLTPRGGAVVPGGSSVCVAPPPVPVGGASVCVAPPPSNMGYGSYVGPPVVPTTPHGSYMPPPMVLAPQGGSGSFVPLVPGASLSRSNSFIGGPLATDGISRSTSFVGPRMPGHILSRSVPGTGSITPRGAAPLGVSSQSSSFAAAPVRQTSGSFAGAPLTGSGSMRLPMGGTSTPSTSFVAMPLGTGGYPPLAPSLAAQAALKVASKEAQPRHAQAVSSQVTKMSRTPTHHRMAQDRSVTPRRVPTLASGYTPTRDWPSYAPTRSDPMAMMHSPDAIRWPRVPA
mmetsp:Transcript_22955/g.42186  ORF Transcript_22955/g.42186 Transcript_22955/m.42186 type:complete len:553 (-) Transcript_22955:59-1717(-)